MSLLINDYSLDIFAVEQLLRITGFFLLIFKSYLKFMVNRLTPNIITAQQYSGKGQHA